jgi:WXG100 family type VII secretion target
VAPGLEASTGQMADTGQKASSVATELRDMLNRLMADLEPLQGAWKGMASGSFGNVKARYTEDSNKLHTALESLAAALGTANTTYSTTDTDLEQTMTQTGADAGTITQALQVL